MYIFESRVRYSETDAQGRLTAEKLIDYFQDCSTFQSEENGVGVAEMRARGLAWIIVYWRVEILRMPRLGERIRIGTIPYAMKGGIGLRNFFMETAPGEAGERLANANSVWTLVDIHTMRPVRIPADVLERYPLGQRLQMQYDARKIRLPAEPGISRPDVTVREYHLDTNRHMNNGQYVRIAAGLLPSGADVRTLRIEYRRQAVLGDRITPVVYSGLSGEETDQADIVCVSLNAKDGKPYAVLEAELQIYHKN
ncbi:MAG: thioesterase [Eubacteriales bacterium]|nr:thioesterase [Eubacteriales bacterium]